MIGQTLDHYRIESKLGEGGMGVVYKALDTHLDRRVAIKILPSDKVADPGRKQRFAQEARAASALNHPNIVTIHDIRSQDGTDFIVMEHIKGRTLDQLIAAKGMHPARALKYAVQIADAMAQAHGAGILHRDLKPSNIMVTDEGRAKLLDFGLAKLLEPMDSLADAITLGARPMTKEGAVLGTAAYMSPEQAEGQKLDGRSDIFSFGSVLYEMVTGRRPFTGESRLSILTKILNQDPTPPSQLGASIPPELEKIILRCMRKDPARRYQTMADLKVALEDVEPESGSGKPVQQGPLRLPWAWAALLLVLLLVAGFFGWQAWRAPGSTEPLRAVPLTTLPGVARYPSFSPDSNHVAFTWTGPKQDNPDIYVQQIGAGQPVRLTTDPSNDYSPKWAPDGRSIAFLRRQSKARKSELRLIPPLGGQERKLAEVRPQELMTRPVSLAWCPESDCLVVTDSPGEGKPDALFVISLETGQKRQLTDPQPPATGDTNPAVSPDGSWLVFRRNAGPAMGELYRLPLARGVTAAGEPQRLTPAVLDADYPTWMPDSKEILFSAMASLWRLIVLGESTPARLPFVGEDCRMPVVSHPQPGRPPRLVYVRSFEDSNIWRIETSALGAAAASPPVVSISSTRQDGQPQLSPDGRRVAFKTTRSGNEEIWLADPDGSNAVQLTYMGARATLPHWSPGGDRIVFLSNFEGQWDVYMVLAAGGKPRNLTSHPAVDLFPSFSANGDWIYFNSNRTGEGQIWKIPALGGEAVPVTNSVGFAPSESPDGAYLYYLEAFDKPSPLWRRPTSGGLPVKVLDGVVSANFVVLEEGIYFMDRPSGEEGTYYVGWPSGETRLQYFDFATRRSTTVARNLGNVNLPLTASQDGRTILYTKMDTAVDDLMLVENFQ